MKTDICARRFEITPAIRNHAENRLAALDHLCPDECRAHLILDHDHHHGEGEYLLKAHLHGLTGSVDAEVRDGSLYAGMDRLIEKLEMQVRRLHARARLGSSEGPNRAEAVTA